MNIARLSRANGSKARLLYIRALQRLWPKLPSTPSGPRGCPLERYLHIESVQREVHREGSDVFGTGL
eukprot:2904234-Amphidinium_carterae.1